MLTAVACSASPAPTAIAPTATAPKQAGPTATAPKQAGPTASAPNQAGATASARTTAAERPDRPPPVLHGGVAVGEACAARVLAGLSPVERAGQVLMIGVPVDAPATAAATVRGYRPG